jgi:hypothetical protein
MPTRKQRRRREKSFRHEYEYVLVDAEGNEVDVEPDDDPSTQTKTNAKGTAATTKSSQKSSQKGRATTRTGRVIQQPSWRRVGKRALIFAPLMFVAVSLIDHRLTAVQHAAQTVFLLAFFLPFSYVMDTVTYRMYLRRTGQAPAKKAAKEKGQPPARSPR